MSAVRQVNADGLVAPRHKTFAAWSVPYYPRLWAMGLLWNMARWMSLFLCSYLVNQLTHSPFLVQIVGASFFAPMFLGGALGGVVSDRLDRRRTMLGLLVALLPISLAMAALSLADGVRVWMAYLFMGAIGIGMVVEMTSRRAFVYDLVGKQHVTNALVLESLAMTSGTVMGGLSAGTVISVLGMGPAFLLVSVFYAVSLAIMLSVPAVLVKRVAPAAAARVDIVQDLKAAFAYARGHRVLISILGITIIMNFFYFCFTPMVPVFADDLGVNAFWTGVLASAPAFGSMMGTFLIASGLKVRRGHAYAGGSVFALVFLCVFALSGWYPLALGALILAGFGTSGFATMQSALVMLSADDAMRGRAMGLLSMSIGVLPFSMLLLGLVAQIVGPPAAVTASAIIGLALMGVWALRRPEAQRLA